jgi:hypothetical protein
MESGLVESERIVRAGIGVFVLWRQAGSCYLEVCMLQIFDGQGYQENPDIENKYWLFARKGISVDRISACNTRLANTQQQLDKW